MTTRTENEQKRTTKVTDDDKDSAPQTLAAKARVARQAAWRNTVRVFLPPGGGYSQHGWISMDGHESGPLGTEIAQK